jgi:hypothetical protein
MGEPVMCAVIIALQTSIAPVAILGIDPFVPIIDYDEDKKFLEANQNVMKGGPICRFRGKDVPCFVCHSPKGSITSDLLVQMIKALDDLEVFRNNDGLRPLLLLDGHPSHLQLPFLEHIMSPKHYWHVYIGVPYGTHLWQVGDSSEQNGSYKMATADIKRKIFESRDDGKWYKTDVIPIVRHAWNCSFGKVQSNKKAICERGWNPLNKALLLHKLVVKTKVGRMFTDDDEPAGHFNTTSHVTIGSPISIPPSRYMEQLNREEVQRYAASGKAKREQKRRESTKNLQDRMRQICAGTRLTSTQLASQGEYTINSEVFLELLHQKRDTAKREEENRAKRREATEGKRQNEYERAAKKLRQCNNNPETLTVAEMRACLHVLPGLSPVKTRKPEMREQLSRRLLVFGGEPPPFQITKLKKPPLYSQFNLDGISNSQSV